MVNSNSVINILSRHGSFEGDLGDAISESCKEIDREFLVIMSCVCNITAPAIILIPLMFEN